MIKCKVFKETVGWSEGLFIFSPDFKFSEIKENLQTSFLNKNNFLGEYDFDPLFLEHLDHKDLNGKRYWFEYMWEHDSDESLVNKGERKGVKPPVVNFKDRSDNFKDKTDNGLFESESLF